MKREEKAPNLTGETIIRKPLREGKEEIPDLKTLLQQEREKDIQETERLGVQEKRPVHITERGRLPLSVSIETDDGTVSRIAEIGDLLPVKCSREFSVGDPTITDVAINLYAGERPLASQNMLIKKAKLRQIRSLRQGRVIINVTFEIDSDYSISIEAIDEGSLQQMKERIDGSWTPSEAEIYKMVQEAKENLEKDTLLRENSRTLQMARECIFHAETALKTAKKTFSADQKRKLKEKNRALKKRIKNMDPATMSEGVGKTIRDVVNSINNYIE